MGVPQGVRKEALDDKEAKRPQELARPCNIHAARAFIIRKSLRSPKRMAGPVIFHKSVTAGGHRDFLHPEQPYNPFDVQILLK